MGGFVYILPLFWRLAGNSAIHSVRSRPIVRQHSSSGVQCDAAEQKNPLSVGLPLGAVKILATISVGLTWWKSFGEALWMLR